MKTVNSISGGKTSAYMAAMFPADYNLFALVRIEDVKCKFPDEKIRLEVEDRIQSPFIGTAEEDTIIYTMLELEQFIGQPIKWVTGLTFEQVLRDKGCVLPGPTKRFCTTHLKIEPMFTWWLEEVGQPVEMRIGYRANEKRRKDSMQSRLNENGLATFKTTIEKNSRGQNKWEDVEWQKPVFPLMDELPSYASGISSFWRDKPVPFAKRNNCVGCFHRHPLLLRKQFDEHPDKMNWFVDQEEKKQRATGKKVTFRHDVTYRQIRDYKPQLELSFEDFSECDSGFCGL